MYGPHKSVCRHSPRPGENEQRRERSASPTRYSLPLFLSFSTANNARLRACRVFFLVCCTHPPPSSQASPVCRRAALQRGSSSTFALAAPRHERRGGFLFCESTYFNKVAVLHFRREERETDCWVNQDLSEHDLPTYAYPQIRKPHPWKAPSSKRVNSSTGGANKLRYVY